MRAYAAILFALVLSACGTAEPVWAPDHEVSRFAYVHDGPPSVTFYTVISNRSGEGGHSAVMVNGSQRVMWDPAGTWWNPAAPERNDLHYGITPRMEQVYIDYHARTTWRVVKQEIPVTRETADRLIASFAAYGAVPKAQCTASTTSVLRATPGFESTPSTWYPKRLMEHVAGMPGVRTEVFFDDDDDNNQPLLRRQVSEIGQALVDAPAGRPTDAGQVRAGAQLN
jgi:hypothetical protein